jgi:hypothetical protein
MQSPPYGSLLTDVSEERIAWIIRVTRIAELGTLAVTSFFAVFRLLVTANAVCNLPILVTLMMQALRFS